MSLFAIILFVLPTIDVNAFETKGGVGAAIPITKIIGGGHIGEPIHQDLTKEGLYFLKPEIKELLADQHLVMESVQSSANHFDNCAFQETIQNINTRYDKTILKLNPKNPDPESAAKEFGQLLHPIQDFYSHSNWVEMKKTNLVDPWYSKWRDIVPFSYTSDKDNQVFSMQIPKDNNTKVKFYQKNLNEKIISVKETDGVYPKIGLVSGVYPDDGSESQCPKDVSIPHGGIVLQRVGYQAESVDEKNELNKDHPKRVGHFEAVKLAKKQTTHEFCRLVELVRGTWGEQGVQVIYDNWVSDKIRANIECPPVEVTALTLPGSAGIHIADGKEIQLQGGIIGFADGTVKLKDGTVILPDRTVIDPSGKKWGSNAQLDPKKPIAILPDGTQVQISTVSNTKKTETQQQEERESIPEISNPETFSLIPDWVKQVIEWWSEEIISDQEFATGLGFLVKEKVIIVDSGVALDTEGSLIIVDEEIEIPNWIRNNAKWYTSGEISEQDFAGGIEFLINENVISFEKKPEPTSFSEDSGLEFEPPAIEYRSGSEDTTVRKQPGIYKFDNIILKRGDYEQIFETAKQNEVSMTYLQKIKKAEYEIAKHECENSIKEYSENQNQDTMKTMTTICDIEKKSEDDLLRTLHIYKTSIESVENAKDVAIKSGLDVFNLEESVVNQQSEIDSLSRNFETQQEIDSAYKSAQKSQNSADEGLQNILHSIIEESSEYEKLSATDKNSISSAINHLAYSSPGSPLLGKELLGLLGMQDPEEEFEDWITVHYGTSIPMISDEKIWETYIEFLKYWEANPLQSEPVDSVLPELSSSAPTPPKTDTSQQDSSIDSVIPELRGIVVDTFGGLTPLLNSDVVVGNKMLTQDTCPSCGSENTFQDEECEVCGHGTDSENSESNLDDDVDCKVCGEQSADGDSDGSCDSCGSGIDYSNDECPTCGEEITTPNECDTCGYGQDEETSTSESHPSNSTESDTPSDEELKYLIPVTMIKGFAYPSFQFILSPSYSGCSEDYLKPAAEKYNTVYHVALDEIGLTWSGGGCGSFGKVSESVLIEEFPITETEATYLTERFGFDDFRANPYNP